MHPKKCKPPKLPPFPQALPPVPKTGAPRRFEPDAKGAPEQLRVFALASRPQNAWEFSTKGGSSASPSYSQCRAWTQARVKRTWRLALRPIVECELAAHLPRRSTPHSKAPGSRRTRTQPSGVQAVRDLHRQLEYVDQGIHEEVQLGHPCQPYRTRRIETGRGSTPLERR